jgi:hypothetical protein
MKRAEALIPRAELRKRMAYWNERMRTSAIVQEGERPQVESQSVEAGGTGDKGEG